MITQIILDLALYFHTGISKTKMLTTFPCVFWRLPKMPLDRLLFLDLRFPSEFFQLLAQFPPFETAWHDVNEEGGRAGPFSNARSLWTSPDNGGNFLYWNSLYRILPHWWLKSASWSVPLVLPLPVQLFLFSSCHDLEGMAQGEMRACVLSVKDMGHHTLIQLPFAKECSRGNRLSTPPTALRTWHSQVEVTLCSTTMTPWHQIL